MIASARRQISSCLTLIIISACSGDPPTQSAPDLSVVANVAIKPGRTSLAVGSFVQLIAEATNAEGAVLSGKTISWTSSRPDVATVSSEGRVTGVATGTMVATATSDGKSARVVLSVQGNNQIVLTSEPGDPVGKGRSYSYTNANAVFQVFQNPTYFRIRTFGNEYWDGEFIASNGLTPGTSESQVRWSGEGISCTGLGSFTIDSLTWGSGVASKLVSIDLRFEQRCEGFQGALRGSIHWRDDDPTVAPGPVIPIPASLWKPPAGATPDSGDFIYLESDSGDYIGQGRTALYREQIVVTRLSRQVLAFERWGGTLIFEAMNSIPELQVGYYGNLMRWPFNNHTAGGLSVDLGSRACNRVSGWFSVDRVHYIPGALAGIEIRFVQHCEEGSPALRGIVRWGRFAE